MVNGRFPMTQSALSFLFGVIAPLTLVGWLLVLH
jgi:hypothetical protein